MGLDGLLYRHKGLRNRLIALVPDKLRTVSVLNRPLTVSQRSEIGVVRLAQLLSWSPMQGELSAMFSLAACAPIGGTFLDVGANVGLYAVPFASLGDALCFRVVAFEPQPETAARLTRNLAAYPCARVLTAAASATTGTLRMDFQHRAGSTTFQASQTGIDVPTIRLDSLELPAPWVLKIDVEGHEAEVLAGLTVAWPKVRALMLDGFSDATIPDRLRAQGFTLFDGRSMQPFTAESFTLLAIRQSAG